MEIAEVLANLNIEPLNTGVSTGQTFQGGKGSILSSFTPVTGQKLSEVTTATHDDYLHCIQTAQKAFEVWRQIPAPHRGEIVRQFGNELRKNIEPLGKLVSWEMGKSLREGIGEVQEMIDICDFAVGLSRQLYGLTIQSERANHRMMEQWHPLGIVGIISAFNFPVAVWSWNTALAWVCGNVCIWKPSEKTPLTAVACQKIASKVFAENGLPDGISCLIVGDASCGKWMASDKNVALVSATGSTAMGKSVGVSVAERFGKTILELGGNNAIIVSPTANMKLALPAIVFGAVGTAGQRCTTTRRLIIHEQIFDQIIEKLTLAYSQLRIGNPLDESNHVGPLIDQQAVMNYLETIKQVNTAGGKWIVEGGVLSGKNYESGCYVKPCIAEVDNAWPIVQHETFAPILYVMKYKHLEDAIRMQNDVPQGLSSSILTSDLQEAERFVSATGSDCGIANVNIGTSGAEIGGAFGGEKETGGGRESGSDAWKAYMRRQTNTINHGNNLPLAQGIKFEL